ncbi:MAG: hypothetical protein JWL59_2232, partial [Chthoniobacteraceae bacterium]|nr:hypothetical protein [Chthoniobacteraceae bacterium]
GQSAPVVLPLSGVYTVVVSVYYYDYPGEYRFRVTMAAPPLQIETENNDSIASATVLPLTSSGDATLGSVAGFINFGGDLDYYKIGTIEAGKTIFLRTRKPAGSAFDPAVSIYNVNGTYKSEVPSGRPFDGVAEVPIDQTGVYYAVARNKSAASGLNYSYLLDVQVSTSGSFNFPNLQVTSLVPPSSGNIQSGQAITLTYAIQNAGNTSTVAGAWSDRVTLSLNPILGDGDDIVIGTIPHVGALASGGSYIETSTLTIPDGIAGEYYLIVEADAGNAVNEFLLEGDNVTVSNATLHVVRAAYPDLVPEAVVINGALSSSALNLSWKTANRGTGSAAQPWKEHVVVRNLTSELVLLDTEREISTVLAAGAVLAQSLDISILSAGRYQASIVVDSREKIFEFDESGHTTAEHNNSGQTIFDVPLDLQISDLAVETAGPLRSGSLVVIRWNDRNSGLLPASGSWSDKVTVLNKTTGATLLNTELYYDVSSLGAITGGQTRPRQYSFQIPDGAAGVGELLFTIIADCNGQVVEFDPVSPAETNNTASRIETSVIAPYPDLIIESINAPASVSTDIAFEVNWTAANRGTAAATGPWVDRIYLSADGLVGNDILLGQFVNAGNLVAGEIAGRAQTVTIPRAAVAAGNYHIVVIADVLNSIVEENETNNSTLDLQSVAVSVTPIPDLIVQSISIPAGVRSGQTIHVQWTVRNVGTGPASGSAWHDQVFLSTDQIADSLDQWKVEIANPKALLPGESYVSGTDLKVPAGYSGTYYVIVKADSGHALIEANDGNNSEVSVAAIQLSPPPDLRVSSVTAPPNGVANQEILVSWTVVNGGSGPVPADESSWQDAIYLSSQPVLDINTATLLGTFAHSGELAQNATYTRQDQAVKIAPGISGNYYIFVAADRANEVYESLNENNNSARGSAAIRIELTPPDHAGPLLAQWRYGASEFTQGLGVSQPAVLSVSASDMSGVSRVEFYFRSAGGGVDTLIDTDANAQDGFQAFWNVGLTSSDGDYIITLKASDTLGNSTVESRGVHLALAPPSAPSITSPATGSTVAKADLVITGTASPYSQVAVYRDGILQLPLITALSDGTFTKPLALVEGANFIQAAMRNRGGEGPRDAVNLTLDGATPSTPVAVHATAQPNGVVQLSWSRPSGFVAGYAIYRSETEFESAAQATRLNAALVTGTVYNDSTPADRVYFYRLSTLNAAGTESVLSSVVSAKADRTVPIAASINYLPQGKYDGAAARFGIGRVDVQLDASEELGSTPFFSITPQGGVPIGVAFQKSGAQRYIGSFVISSGTQSGLATATVSMRDVAGNRGTAITVGGTITIDTAGPRVVELEIQPGRSVKNDPSAPKLVTFTARLDTLVKAGTAPEFSYSLSNTSPTKAAVSNVVQGADSFTWIATILLPPTAGQTTENLELSFIALDDLDNIGTVIVPSHGFQVYQGDLPGLDSPFSLTAKSKPGGHIELNWRSVDGAADYQLFRRPSGSGLFVAVSRSAGLLVVTELPLVDGVYDYTVAAIRQENNETSVGTQSNIATAASDRVAPTSPLNLQVELTSQGVKTQWLAPAGTLESVTYRVFRSALNGSDSQIVAEAVSQLVAIDPSPEPAHPVYYVTAVDNAGNQSQPSNRVYQNVALLPVRTLEVTQVDSSAPLVSWSQVSGGIAGYDIYQGTEGERTKLNLQGILTGTNFTDAGYSPAADRHYTVITVADNQAESLGRNLTLPRTTVTLAAGSVINRGVMNRLQFEVKNESGTAISHARMRVTLDGKEHSSSFFSVAAGSAQIVPVVVGGYPTLLGDTAPVAITLEIVPNEGEKVSIVRHSNVPLGSGKLQVDVVPGDFLQGGNGKVQFRVANGSEEEIEFTTASGSGSLPSPEIRFTLLDTDGNVIATEAFKAVTGNSVVTLPNGRSVVRLPAGAEYVSPETSVALPSTAPENLIVRLEIDTIYYHQGQVDQVMLPGLQSRRDVSALQTTYTGEVTSVSPAESNGDQDVVIAGHAIARIGGQAIPNARLLVVVSKDGFERTNEVVTDGSGNFAYSFRPATGEGGGLYNVWAVHPDLTARKVQQTFVVRRVLVTPRESGFRTPRNYSQPLSFSASTGEAVTVHNLRLQYLPEDQVGGVLPEGIIVQVGEPIPVLGPKLSASLGAKVSGSGDAAQRSDLVLRAVSDESGSGGWQKVVIHLEFGEASALLRTTPGFITTGVNPGGSVTETVNYENAGLADAQGLSFSILNQNGSVAPNWVSLTSSGATDLVVGANRPVGINLQPPASIAEGDYFFILRARTENYTSSDVNVHVAVTTAGQGGAIFKVRDPYTGTLDENGSVIQGLRNARIELQNEQVISIFQTLTTDAFGEASASNLPAGPYKYRVNADKHVTSSGRLWIRPGASANQDVAMQYNPVTVEFEVVPITIQDRYNIVLKATFETNVPAPVIVIDPPAVNLPRMCKGDVYNGEFTITNYGLIRADDIKVPVPQSDAYFKVELLGGIPTTLGAGEVMRVAYRMTAIANFGGNCGAIASSEGRGQSVAVTNPGVLGSNGAGDNGLAPGEPMTLASIGEGGGCVSYVSLISVTYAYVCSNGLTFNGSLQYLIAGQFGDCGGIGIGWSWLATGSGPGGGTTYTPLPVTDGVECWGWEIVDVSTRTWNDRDWTLSAVGCSVDSLTRRYEDDVLDINVPVPGRQNASVAVSRRIRGTQWSMLDKLVVIRDGMSVMSVDAPAAAGAGSDGTATCTIGDQSIKLRRVKGGSRSLCAVLAGGVSGGANLSQYYWKGVRVDKPIKGITFTPLPDGEGQLTEADGSWTKFDRYQNIAATGRNNITYTTTLFDARHRPIQVTDGQRVLLSYEWIGEPGNAANPSLLAAVQDLAGRRVEYSYLGGRLAKVKDTGGKETSYEYDSEGKITKVTDATGETHLISYNGAAVRSVLDKDGRGKYFDFNTDSATGEYHTAIRSSSGTVEETTFDKIGQLTEWKINGELKERRVYTGATAATITDENNRTWHESYDEWRLLKQRINPDGSSISMSYDPVSHLPVRIVNENGLVTTISYDLRRNVTQIIEAFGTPSERKVQFVYDAADRPTLVTWLGDANTAASTVALAYDAQGNLLRLTDPLNKVREILSRTSLNSVKSYKDANGKTWQLRYDSHNRVNASVDPDNRLTQFEFDEFNNLTSVTAPSNRKVNFGYDINNSLVSILDPAGSMHRNEYDSGGRLSRSVDRAGHSLAYEYDNLDRLIKGFDEQGNQILYGYPDGSASADPVTITFPTFTRTLTYNFRHQPLTVVDSLPEGVVHTTSYNYSPTGALLTIVDPENHQTTFTRDVLDRVTSMTREGVGTSSFAYDDRDHVIAFTNPNGQVWTYAYDAAGQLVEEVTPLGKRTAFVYDNIGNLTVVTRPTGAKIVRGFDALGRVTTVSEYAPGSGVPAKTVVFTRDEDGRITSYNDGTTTGTYGFDAVGRLATETINYGAFTSTVSYSYGANGQLASYTSPSGAVTTYSYASANRLIGSSVAGVGEFAVNGYQVDAATGMTYPGGTKVAYTRDAYSRPTQIKSSDPANTAVFDLKLGYSAGGNVSSRDTGAGPVSLQYDAGNRLKQGASSSYTYDPNGNRLTDSTAGGGTWQYDLDDRMTSDGRTTYQYDENGSLVRKISPTRTWDYSYDQAGRLVGVTSGFDVIQYHYDPSGRRIAKNVNGTVTYYRHCALGICAEYDAFGALLREYGYAADASFGAAPLYLKSAGQVYFYHADQLGTPVKLTDVSGAVVWAATYDDFGKANITVNLVENNLRFPGQYFDAETGLHNNWHRYYDPEAGRYFTRDQGDDGTNLYIYVANNPLGFSDPDGLRRLRNALIGAGTGALAGAGTGALVGAGVGSLAGGVGAVPGATAGALAGAGWGAFSGAITGLLKDPGASVSDVIESSAVSGALGGIIPGGVAAQRAATVITPEIAATFAGGKYTSTVLEDSIVAYRYSGGVSGATGRFLTTAETVSQISSPTAASIALNLPAGATAETLNSVVIPAGTRIFVGGVEGGADSAVQIFIRNAGVLILQ